MTSLNKKRKRSESNLGGCTITDETKRIRDFLKKHSVTSDPKQALTKLTKLTELKAAAKELLIFTENLEIQAAAKSDPVVRDSKFLLGLVSQVKLLRRDDRRYSTRTYLAISSSRQKPKAVEITVYDDHTFSLSTCGENCIFDTNRYDHAHISEKNLTDFRRFLNVPEEITTTSVMQTLIYWAHREYNEVEDSRLQKILSLDKLSFPGDFWRLVKPSVIPLFPSVICELISNAIS